MNDLVLFSLHAIHCIWMSSFYCNFCFCQCQLLYISNNILYLTGPNNIWVYFVFPQTSLEFTRQKWSPLTAKQCIAISLNYAQFLQPAANLDDRAFSNHHLYFIVMTEQQFRQFEEHNRVRNRWWFEYQSYSRPAQESEGDDLKENKKKDVDADSRIKVKNYAVTGKQRRRNRYFISPESYQSITGTPLPMPRIMILQYFMLPNMNSDQRRITLEAGDDPPVPRGMTMAMTLIRKYQQAPGPANVPQHGVPLQQPHDYLEEMVCMRVQLFFCTV